MKSILLSTIILTASLVIYPNSNRENNHTVKFKLIRNATFVMEYAGKKILADPMFSSKGEIQSFAGISKNPTVELPMEIPEILNEIDCVIVSHNHPDHFDEKAEKYIPKDIPFYCQNGEQTIFQEKGFKNVIEINDSAQLDSIEIIRVDGEHGKGEVLNYMGKVSGFILKAQNYPVIYWIGDSILNKDVKENIQKYQPDMIITHSGGAIIPQMGNSRILMDDKETIDVYNLSKKATVIAIHTESLDHCPVTRKQIRETANNNNISPEDLIIPADGETIYLSLK